MKKKQICINREKWERTLQELFNPTADKLAERNIEITRYGMTFVLVSTEQVGENEFNWRFVEKNSLHSIPCSVEME